MFKALKSKRLMLLFIVFSGLFVLIFKNLINQKIMDTYFNFLYKKSEKQVEFSKKTGKKLPAPISGYYIDLSKLTYATIFTDLGKIKILLIECNQNVVNNFIYLAKNGYYDDSFIAYRDKASPSNFIVGIGQYELNYYIQSFNETFCLDYGPGVVGVLNPNNPKYNGGDFFITTSYFREELKDKFARLYPLIGKVVEGQDIVDEIAKQEYLEKECNHKGCPLVKKVKIKHISIEYLPKPKDAKVVYEKNIDVPSGKPEIFNVTKSIGCGN